jgi:hypothetical protein
LSFKHKHILTCFTASVPKTTAEAVCDSRQSTASTVQVKFSPLSAERPPTGALRDFNNNPGLQLFARARYIQLDVRSYHGSDTARTDFNQPLPVFPFHAIKEISVSWLRCATCAPLTLHVQVSGRCFCNGHAQSCVAVAPVAPGFERFACDCQHKTTELECRVCEPLYNANAWVPKVPCQPCQCNAHSDSCIFDADKSAANALGYGGVCQACQHNTVGNPSPNLLVRTLTPIVQEGDRCDTCADGHFRDTSELLTSPRACASCGCDARGVLIGTNTCDKSTGQCRCKPQVLGKSGVGMSDTLL